MTLSKVLLIAGERLVKRVGELEYAFRWCPAGTFQMGSPKDEKDRDDDEIQHTVTLTKCFWMLETQVTQGMWESIMGKNPSHFKFIGKNLPVEQVSWDDCQQFCKRLSKKMGEKITLPTEAPWEYACRAGTTGAHAGSLDYMAWYGENSDGKIHKVGRMVPNAWGLYDMHGNVVEWCADGYGDYPVGSVTDPTGPTSAPRRILRGGCWCNYASLCRSAKRVMVPPDLRYVEIGFRCSFCPDR